MPLKLTDRLYDPDEISRRSYEKIERQLDGNFDCDVEREVTRRVVHTTGDFGVANHLKFSGPVPETARRICRKSLPVVTDVSMVKAGISKAYLNKLNLSVHCYVHGDETRRRAESLSITRSAAGLEIAGEEQEEFVFVCGNAPTSLFWLLDRKEFHPERIPLVIGAPVGFVSVKESKRELHRSAYTSIVLAGTRGGSPVAASIFNGLMKDGLENDDD